MKKLLLLLVVLPSFLIGRAQCPNLATGRKAMASSFHSSVIITYDSTVTYWGDGAGPTVATVGTDILTPQVLTGYTGKPRSVAAGSIGAAEQHALYLHTTTNIYGWGYSSNTIVDGTAGNVVLTTIALPASLTIDSVSFIEGSTCGLAIVTNGGTVWVRKGNSSSASGRIYGDGSTTIDASGSATWHQVKTAAATPITGVTRIAMSGQAMMAMTASGIVYVWGDKTFNGDGTTAATDRAYATVVTKPSGVTPADVMINTPPTTTITDNAVEFILGTDGNLYGLGDNGSGVLGQGNTTSSLSWLTVKGLSNVIQIGSNNPYSFQATNYAMGALTSSGKLYLWGANNNHMIASDTISTPVIDSTYYTVPRIPPNFNFNNAAIGYFEMGGHTTAAFLAGSSKFCYVGHKIRGSMGDGTSASSNRYSFDCINTPDAFVCPPAPAIGCPLPTASDLVASSNHATLTINGTPSVSFWGQGSSTAEAGLDVIAAKILYEYNGSPIGVAAGGLSETVAAQGTQMFLHTTAGIWGWGYSANTIMANRAASVPITYIAPPSSVAVTNISFIRAARGGLALVTTSGNVWVRAGAASLCSANIYGDGSSALDAASSTAWHQVMRADSTSVPLSGITEMSFAGTAAIAIASSGKAYVWGDNTVLGNGTASASRSRATLMTLHSDFTGSVVPRTAEIIQSGSNTAIEAIVGSNNLVYTAGQNLNGALGTGSSTFSTVSLVWNKIALAGIRKMTSNNPFSNGFYSLAALTLNGNLYMWGSNTNGILGQSVATANVTTPTRVDTTVIAAGTVSNVEMGGAETIVFSKSSSQFYFGGETQGGSTADGTADGIITPFTLKGSVSNCAGTTFSISGHLYNDNTGLQDSLVNGTLISTLRTSPMYANLLDVSGNVIATTPISGGTYTFSQYPISNYYVQIATVPGTIFAQAPVDSLPPNWVYSGEQIGTVKNVATFVAPAVTRIPVALSADITDVNFGVQQLPAPISSTLAARTNPGGTKTSTITGSFTGVDTNGSVSQIHFTTFPTNITSITIGSTTYTSGTWPGGGVTVASSTAVQIDPVDGTLSAVIPFKVIDNAGFESPTSANVTVPFVMIPPVASNITAPSINSSNAATAIPQLLASNPSGIAIASYQVLTLPTAAQGVLYYCASAPVACSIGSLTAVSTSTSLTPAQAASLYFDPAQTYTGNVTFTYKATDSSSQISNTANYIIPVFNNPPTTQNISIAQMTNTNGPTKLPNLIGADGDGTVVSYNVLSIPSSTQGVLTYCSNGTDTCTGTVMTISGPTTLTPAQMMTLKLDPDSSYTGNYVFRYAATDNNGNVSDSSYYTIPLVSTLGGNLPPVATNIIAQNINNSSPATPIPNLLGSDPDGSVTQYTIGSSVPNPTTQGTLYYCSTAPATCSVGSLTAVTAGTILTPAQALSLQFAPVTSFIGNAAFTYTVTDNGTTPLTSSPATYIIPVVNIPPVANPTSVNPILNTLTSPTLLPPLSGNDADGTVTSYNITSVPSSSQGTLKYCASAPATCTSGTLTTISGPLSGLTPAQVATLNFIPNSGYTGNYVFNFTTVDNNGLVSQPATFTIPVVATALTVGQPPVAYSYNAPAISSASTSSLSSALTGTDPDGTISSYTITSIPVSTQGALTYCTTPPSTGCGTAATPGLVLTPAQAATLLFTPNANFTGTATFTYINTDNDGNPSNTATVTIPVVNNPPVASNVSNPSMSRFAGATTIAPLAATDADGTVTGYTILTVPNTNLGVLKVCTTPPSTGCTAVTAGQVLTPAQINKLSFTPDTSNHSPVTTFLYAPTDNSGNIGNVASVNIPLFDAFPLPIELLSFTATKQGYNALLEWTTGVQTTPINYDLQHSVDGKIWAVISSQKGNGSNEYSYLHTNLQGTHYYRLKLIDVDNSYKLSPVRTLNFDNAQGYSIMVQPNPVSDKLFVTSTDGSVIEKVIIYSNEGLKLQELNQLNSGAAIDMNAFATGLYLFKIQDKNGNVQVIKVSKK